jgi:asparagine synthase (glutamine-hydrolysing)
VCGINLIHAYGRQAPSVERDELIRSRDSMSRRGPDAEGEWLAADGRIGFGHRRLSIIDTSARGNQPMFTPDRRYAIIFNGEIYNFHELRAELEREGELFESHSDSEVLLRLYERRGAAMLPHLRGMYAFAIWDALERRLFLARDPYGIKPLYYSDVRGTFRAASQVRALIAGGALSTAPDPAGVAAFLLRGNVTEPFTIYEEIRTLPAGTFMTVDGGGPGEPKRHFSVAAVLRDAVAQHRHVSAEERQETVRQALLESVRYHLVSDVPVGAFLSAGKDSTSLVGLAAEAGFSGLHTMTLRFEEHRGTPRDEAPLAETVAALYGADHSTHTLTRSEFESEVPRFVEAMDQPTIDALNSYFVSRAAAQRGLKVVLSGTGGDELFGGYTTFRKIPRFVRMTAPLSRIPLLPDALYAAHRRLTRQRPRMSPKSGAALKYGRDYPGAYLLKRGLFLPPELPEIMGEAMAREGLRRLDIIERIREAMTPDPVLPKARVAALESALFMRDQLLRDIDWTSMAHSLEVRVPLVDAHLLQQLAPVIFAQSDLGKDLLADSPRPPLPPEVRNRKKTGFIVPIRDWLAAHSNGRPAMFGMRGWALQLLEWRGLGAGLTLR